MWLRDNAERKRKSGQPFVQMLVIENNVKIFSWFLGSFKPASIQFITCEFDGSPLHDAVGITYEKDITTKYNAYLPSIWAKE